MPLRRLVLLTLLSAICFAQQQAPPSATAPAGPPPAEIIRRHKPHAAPPLTGTGRQARDSAMKFIDWASASFGDETEDVRRALAVARQNRDIAQEFCDEANRARAVDHSRSLVVLGLLGEMRSPVGQECLTKFLHIPFPAEGHVVNGEIVEQTVLGTLQAKAVDGLAYLRNPRADEEVLWAAGKHPSRIVRAEAIDAYLWNHNDSQQAKSALLRYIRPDEKIFVDRPRRGEGEGAEQFNPKLQAFLKAHPEVKPPAPAKAKPNKAKRAAEEKPIQPPSLDQR